MILMRFLLIVLLALNVTSALAAPLRQTLLPGDSQTSNFGYTSAGECPYTNAGIGGADIRSLADAAPFLAKATKPYVAHIMIGTNNIPMAEDDPEWLSMYDDLMRLVDAFQTYGGGTKVVLWYPPPVDDSVAATYPAAHRYSINSTISQVAAAQGGIPSGVYVEWWTNTLVDGSGYALSGVVGADGVHITASTHSARQVRLAVNWKNYWAGLPWPC